MCGCGTVIRHLGQSCFAVCTGVEAALLRSVRSVQSHAIFLALVLTTSSSLWSALSHTVVNILAALAACSKLHEKHSACMIRLFLEILNFIFQSRGNSLETQMFFHSFFFLYLSRPGND